MRQHALKRLLLSVPTLLGVSVIIFTLVRLIPGDVVLVLLAERGVNDPALIAEMRQALGLDRPVHEQYLFWIWNILHGDLGISLWTREPILPEILRRIPVSAELAMLSLVVSLAIAIPVGILAAARQDTVLDYVGRLLSIAGLSMPDFWIGTLLLLLPSLWFRWIPSVVYVPFHEDPFKNLEQFVFPSLALGAYLSASTMRMTRSSLLEVLRQDYIRTAWAKGLRERTVIYRHALKNALIPVLTLIGSQFGRLLGGTVVIEQVFGLPGLGRLTLEAVLQRDYPQIQINVLFFAIVYLVVNLLVDLAYAWFDPRIRYG